MTDRSADGVDDVLLHEDVYRHALEVGRRAAGVSGPNPPVGCVIVRDGHLVGEGATRAAGGAHAEIVALEAAGAATEGATAVVTLEPCSHHGRTPPCVDALLRAGVAEVHVLLRDPDRIARGGIERLASAGVHVVDVGALRPDLAASAAHDLRGFLSRVRSGRPHVTLKLAQAADGTTVAARGGYLTGEEARREVHALRAAVDAVLVGGATVRADDPRLDVRHVPTSRQPVAVVLSASGDIPPRARVVRAGTILVVGDGAGPHHHVLEERGVCVVEGATRPDGMLDLNASLEALLAHRILTVLAEPGVRLASALLGSGLVDVLELHVAGGAHADHIIPAIPGLRPILDGDSAERRATGDGDLIVRTDVGVHLSTAALEGAA